MRTMVKCWSVILLAFFGVVLVAPVTLANPIKEKLEKLGLDPHELIVLNGTQYYFSYTNIVYNMTDAAIFCTDLGMALSGFETISESNMIYTFLSTIGRPIDPHWTSGKYIHKPYWIWSNSGTIFTDSFGAWYRPPSADTDCTYCVMYQAQFGLSEEPCDTVMGFICEAPPPPTPN